MDATSGTPRIFILLSTYNGARHLPAQLDSLLTQTHADWVLLWRDDGSTDRTLDILHHFALRAGGRCRCADAPTGRLRPTASFMALLRAAAPLVGPRDLVSFADQDDVWLPAKLARGAAALGAVADATPALYSARQVLVDDALSRLGLSVPIHPPPGFPASLTQNLATGCTVIMNRAAVTLVVFSRPSSASLHDWWCYLLVTAAGGRFLIDDEPVVLYRQHAGNLVGAPPTMARRAVAALRRGPSVFMDVLRQNVAALMAQRHMLTASARADLAVIDQGLRGGVGARLAALRLPGLRRQTWPETLVFRLWFLFG